MCKVSRSVKKSITLRLGTYCIALFSCRARFTHTLLQSFISAKRRLEALQVHGKVDTLVMQANEAEEWAVGSGSKVLPC